MSLLNILNRVASTPREPFVCPLFSAGVHKVYTFQNGRPFDLNVRSLNAGWYYVNASGHAIPNLNEMARVEYLEALPRFMVIALFPVDRENWMVVPYNNSDAAQRGWGRHYMRHSMQGPIENTPAPNTFPRVARLTRGEIKPFDLLWVRQLGMELVFDEMDTVHAHHATFDLFHTVWHEFNTGGLAISEETVSIINVTTRRNWTNEFKNAWDTVLSQVYYPELKTRKIELEKARGISARKTVEDRVAWHLDFVGASLASLEQVATGYMVTYEFHGKTNRVIINAEAQQVSSGICLNGTDRQHNLSNAILVMDEAVRLGRPNASNITRFEGRYNHDDEDHYDDDEDE